MSSRRSPEGLSAEGRSDSTAYRLSRSHGTSKLRRLARRPGVAPDAAGLALARRRDRRREGHPHPRRTATSSCSARGWSASSTSGPRQKGAHMSRFEEVVNEAIGEVILGESAFRAETLAERIAELVRERQDALRAEVTIEARYPEHKPAPVSGIRDAGDLHAVRQRGRLRARHAPARRRRRPGHDRVPVRAGARRRRARASACVADGFTTTQIEPHLRARPRRHPQPARPRHAAHRLPRGLRRRASTRATLLRDRRGLDVERDLRADEALRRGRRRREGPPPPALRRGLRARDDRAASSTRFGDLADEHVRLRPPGEPRDDPPAQRRRRALRRCSASCAHELATGEHLRTTRRCASGSTARAAAQRADASRAARRRPRRSPRTATRLLDAPRSAGRGRAARPGRTRPRCAAERGGTCEPQRPPAAARRRCGRAPARLARRRASRRRRRLATRAGPSPAMLGARPPASARRRSARSRSAPTGRARRRTRGDARRVAPRRVPSDARPTERRRRRRSERAGRTAAAQRRPLHGVVTAAVAALPRPRAAAAAGRRSSRRPR